MADASKESKERLVLNVDGNLSFIESLLPDIQNSIRLIDSIKKQGNSSSSLLDSLAVCEDVLLGSYAVIYDIMASLKRMIKTDNAYIKRYQMSSLNICFFEGCKLFVDSDGGKSGILNKLESSATSLNLVGEQFLVRHIIDDIDSFCVKYCHDSALRNLFRHYDDPIKMYEAYAKLNDEDIFAKGVSEMMAYFLETRVVCEHFLQTLIPFSRKENCPEQVDSKSVKSTISELFNTCIADALRKKNVHKVIGDAVIQGTKEIDKLYKDYSFCEKAKEFLSDSIQCEDLSPFDAVEDLIRIRMMAEFMRMDIGCAMLAYLESSTDMERAQSLRHIQITKQAALTHLYGYTKDTRQCSLWNKIVTAVERENVKIDSESLHEQFKKMTTDIKTDSRHSNIYVHYRYRDDLYVSARLDAYSKMNQMSVIYETLPLLNLVKEISQYSLRVLDSIAKRQEEKRIRSIAKFNDMFADLGNLISKSNVSAAGKQQMKEVMDKLKCSIEAVVDGIN